MKTLMLTAAAVAALATTAASAQPYGRHAYDDWRSISQRQAQLDHRIDVGVRNGQLTRNEAYRLRAQFRSLVRLENRYRANGLTGSERADLDRRYDNLSYQIRAERHDGERYGYNDRERDGYRPY